MTLDAGLEQIKLGRAWWFRKYADEQTVDDQRIYAEAEAAARAAHRGLWRDADPVAPWDWRAQRNPNRSNDGLRDEQSDEHTRERKAGASR